MADIKRCDLCGQPYDPYNTRRIFVNFDDSFLKQMNSIILYIDNGDGIEALRGEWAMMYDICPKCKDRLLKLIWDIRSSKLADPLMKAKEDDEVNE